MGSRPGTCNHPPSHPQPRRLRLLAAAAENGGIRAAAQRLAIDQPALGRSLRTIEDREAGSVRTLRPVGEEFNFPARLTTRKFDELSPARRAPIAEIGTVRERIGDEL